MVSYMSELRTALFLPGVGGIVVTDDK